MQNIEDYIKSKRIAEVLEGLQGITWEELSKQFTESNKRENHQGNWKQLFALVDFDYTKWETLKPEYRNDSQRFWVFSNQNKVFQSWAGGYSLFARCVHDNETDRMERLFNSRTIRKAYIISAEQYDYLTR